MLYPVPNIYNFGNMGKENIHIISIGGSVMHDLLTVTTQLKKNGKLDYVGGAYYVTQLTTRVNSASNIEYHARIILEQSIKRQLIEAKKKNIPILSYPEYVKKLSNDKHRVVIAGSHGKTTITSMLMHVLKFNNVKFDYVIGAKAWIY